MLAGLIDRFGRMLTDRNARSYGRFDPLDTVVLVLSPQVDIFVEDGEWSNLCRIGPDRQAILDFLSECRGLGVAIYHSPIVWGGDDQSSAINSTLHLRELRKRRLLKRGEPGAAIDPALVAGPDHVLHARYGLNAFVKTALLEHLEKDDRSRLIIVGGIANADLDSTARAAVEYDFDVTVIKDLTFAYDARDWVNTLSITLPRIVSRVLESREILDCLSYLSSTRTVLHSERI